MLLIAVSATWAACFTGRMSITRDSAAIEALHALAPELQIRNRHEYACLQIDRTDDIREFHCYLPLGHKYKLHLLWSKEFVFNDKEVQSKISETLTAGNHQILLKELPEQLTVFVDEIERINVPRKRPTSQSTSSTGVSERFNSQWYPLDQPLTLLRLRESVNGQIVDDSGPGITLWITSAD